MFFFSFSVLVHTATGLVALMRREGANVVKSKGTVKSKSFPCSRFSFETLHASLVAVKLFSHVKQVIRGGIFGNEMQRIESFYLPIATELLEFFQRFSDVMATM